MIFSHILFFISLNKSHVSTYGALHNQSIQLEANTQGTEKAVILSQEGGKTGGGVGRTEFSKINVNVCDQPPLTIKKRGICFPLFHFFPTFLKICLILKVCQAISNLI